MIKIIRKKPPVAFNLPSVKRNINFLYSIQEKKNYGHENNLYFPKTYINLLGNRNSIVSAAKKKLKIDFASKCCYCESRTEGELEHFRPKSNARGLDGEFSHLHYWWLEYEWNNLYLACPTCKRNKASWFPVNGKRCEPKTPYNEIISEDNMLIDPCSDNPEEHFDFTEDGYIRALSARGQFTIDIIKLNRQSLLNMRRIEITKYLNRLGKGDNPLNILSELNTPRNNSEYKGAINSIIQKKISLNQQAFKISYRTKPKSSILNSYVTSIKINNFKKIRNIEFHISDEASKHNKAPWTLLIGENSVGKSSFLQSIALCLSDSEYINKLVNSDEICNDQCSSGYVELMMDNKNNKTRIDFNKKKRLVTSNIIGKTNYTIGFGSTRISNTKGLRTESNRKFIRIANLFDHKVALNDAKEWLLQLDIRQRKSAGRIITKALGLKENWSLIKRGLNLILTDGNQKYHLDKLSDGYKSSIGVIVNIMIALNKSTEGFDEISGIVLIDEIELHLHPRWKMRFIKSFREAFPKIQVFATTHDPLCLKGLFDGEVILLKEVENGRIECITNLPSVQGLTAEQLLTSEFFGLNSTIDPNDEDIFSEYYLLLGKQNPDNSRLKELKKLLQTKEQLGNSLREELMYTAIDEILAKEKIAPSKSRSELKTETVNLIAKLFKKNDIH